MKTQILIKTTVKNLKQQAIVDATKSKNGISIRLLQKPDLANIFLIQNLWNGPPGCSRHTGILTEENPDRYLQTNRDTLSNRREKSQNKYKK